MTPRFYKKLTAVVFALVAAIFFSISYAYASSNTMGSHSSGDGQGLISGYVIDNISYQHAQDPSQISSVSFSLDAPADIVKIQLTTSQTGWYQCKNKGGFEWTCDTNNISILKMDQLRVIASGN